MALIFVWSAGAFLGLSFDLFAVAITAALITPVVFVASLPGGIFVSLWASAEALACLQIGYACGLGVLLLTARVLASRRGAPGRRTSAGADKPADAREIGPRGGHQ